MAKRFTDTDKWKKPFIRTMKTPYKLLWLYILDECDHAGIWQVDLPVAQIKIGEKLNLDEALKYLDGKVFSFAGGEKWFIPDFIDFQYGKLKNENRAHNSVIQILLKYNLIDNENKPLISSLQRAKDKDMDKDKELDMDKDKGGDLLIWPSFEDFWNLYDKKVGEKGKLFKKWQGLTQAEKEKIMQHIPVYKLAQPDKKYRKNPETYLNNKGWNDEIIPSEAPANTGLQDFKEKKLGIIFDGQNS